MESYLKYFIKLLLMVGVLSIFDGCFFNTETQTIKSGQMLEGTVVDAEIANATVYLDLNGNGKLDSDEPFTKSDDKGNFKLILDEKQAQNKSFLEHRALLVAEGGKDIRTKKEFTDVLSAPILDENRKIVISPISTLAAQWLIAELEENNNSVQKRSFSPRNEYVDSIKERIRQIYENLGEIFQVETEMLLANPIELALQGNTKVLEVEVKIQKVAKLAKKALKRELRRQKRAIFYVYKSIATNLKQLKKEAKAKGDKALVEALNSALEENRYFVQELKQQVTKEITTIIETIDTYFKENEDELKTGNVDNFVEDLDKKTNVDDENVTDTNTTDNTDTNETNTTPDNPPTPPNVDENLTDKNTTKIDTNTTDGNETNTTPDTPPTPPNVDENLTDKNTTNVDTNETNVTDTNTTDVNETNTTPDTPPTPPDIDENGTDENITDTNDSVDTPPTSPFAILLNGESEESIILGNSYQELGAKVVGNIDKNVTLTIQGDVNSSKLGDYIIKYIAKDSKGNKVERERIVHIISPEVLVKDLNIQQKACEHFGSLKIDNYTYSNNTWGKDRLYEGEEWVQCAFSYLDENSSLKGGFYWGWPNGKGNVKAYPEVIYGRKFSSQRNPESGWPVKVSDMKEVFVDIAYRDINFTGKYNIAPEWWLHLDKNTSMDNIKYEIMVRLDPNGFHPSNPWIKDVTIDGIVYDVYKDEPWGKNNRQFFNFVAHKKITNIKLHPNAFMDFLYKNGVNDIPDLYYADIEMGVEVINGSGLFLLDTFKVTQEEKVKTIDAKKPLTSIMQYSNYTYLPDINDSSLTYSISNKPEWAEFDSKSGKLSGIPTKVKIYKNIEINATNGTKNFQIVKFDLNVLPALNIAHDFGKAKQGSTSGDLNASLVIDGNISSFNHTACNENGNWWELELPKNTKVGKVTIYNRSTWQGRLEGAKLYFSKDPYEANSTKEEIALLKGIYKQTINLNSVKEVEYVIVKAKDAECLHMGEVEIFGTLPKDVNFSLKFIKKEFDFTLPYDAKVGDTLGQVLINNFTNKEDYNFTIADNSVPFNIDKNGVIKLSREFDWKENQQFSFNLILKDNNHEDNATINVRLLSKNGVKVERWYNIEGTSVNDLLNSEHYKDTPDEISINKVIEFNEDKASNFGQRDSFVFRAPISAYYTFAIIGDDGVRLLANDKVIAERNWWGNYKDWESADKSEPIFLTKGESLKMVAFLKEAGGAENIAVGYSFNDDNNFTTLPASTLYITYLTKENSKPIILTKDSNFTIQKSASDIGTKVAQIQGISLEGNLTYSILNDVPFNIDEDGNIYIKGVLEAKDYEVEVNISNPFATLLKTIYITSLVDTKELYEAKGDFEEQARAFTSDSDLDSLLESYMDYSKQKAKKVYDNFFGKEPSQEVMDFIEDNDRVKMGLYASLFPVNPYYIKNLDDFLKKLKEDGRDDDFIQRYQNVWLGFSINAKERGIFDNPVYGDTFDHHTTDYKEVAKYNQMEKKWREEFEFIVGYKKLWDFRDYMRYKYHLTMSEQDDINWHNTQALKKAVNDGYTAQTITPQVREKYGISYSALNVYRLSLGLDRDDCFKDGNPCAKIQKFIDDENNDSLTINHVLGYLKDYKQKIGLIYANDFLNTELRGEFNIVPKKDNFYKLMPFYDLALWKITLDNIAPIDFSDDEPNWPIFDYNLSTQPWQLMALEQGAQKQECEYIKSRFFETDKAKLQDIYPPNAVDGGEQAQKRFIEYTTYTWDYDKPEIWFRNSKWSPDRTMYRILQDGGVCGRQSTMGQHVNECLNRPSIGTGQPGHRAWVGVFKDEQGRLYTKIGYKVGSRESAVPHGHLIYAIYTKAIRPSSLERFNGVVTGVGVVGEEVYDKSMMLQHIAHIMQEEDASSVEALLLKAVEIAPQNTDAWYQLALYYASKDQKQKIADLAESYKKGEFFIEPKDIKTGDWQKRVGANNLGDVTAKNILLAVLKAPTINDGLGEDAAEGKEILWDYFDTYEKEYRSILSYNAQNKFLANYYLKNLQDPDGFIDEVKDLFERFLTQTHSGDYVNDYFRDVDFKDINKTELFSELALMTKEANIDTRFRNEILKKLLNQDDTMLASRTLVDVCTNSNLSECQSVSRITLGAKAVYLITNKLIGDDKEISVSERGKEGFSKLVVRVVDQEDGKEESLVIRIAKKDGDKLLKMNDPTEVSTDSSEYIIWIDPSDNPNLKPNHVYNAKNRIVLIAKKRVQNNEEYMGDIIINVKDLVKGENIVVNELPYKSEVFIDNSTSIYFTAITNVVGPIMGVWFKEGYSLINVKVVDDNNQTATIKLRATNADKYQLNSGTLKEENNWLTFEFDPEDNPNIELDKHYKSIKPIVIDAKMWHKNSKLKKRFYFSFDLTIE